MIPSHPAFLAIWILLCLLAGYLGRNTRVGSVGIFLAALVFTPLLTLLFLALCTGDRRRA